MKPYRLTRGTLASLSGRSDLVLAQDVRDATGAIIGAKGSYLTRDAVQRLATVDWSELHAIELEADDVHEAQAGARLARAAAGQHVSVGAMTAGHWPLQTTLRGIIRVEIDALHEINTLGGLALYTLFDGQVVEQKETIARAKIIPFAVQQDTVQSAEAIARGREGVVRVRSFMPHRLGAVIQESLGERAMARAHTVLAEKIAWFGSTLLTPRFVTADGASLAGALREQLDQGAEILLIAGSRPMDPLDPAYAALAQLGARIERQGMPAHPGSLLWLGSVAGQRGRECALVGLPSCGLFSQASVFDLVLPRLLAGERLTSESLASFGHGGLLTRDMQFRFPPYRSGARRGEVLDEP